jgi:acetoin utilization deacetylase AcuC-like enzyme
VLSFQPDLVLVSAGFDAYAGDSVSQLALNRADYAEMGRWLNQCTLPVAAILEGGYSSDLPLLIDDFLSAWDKPTPPSA